MPEINLAGQSAVWPTLDELGVRFDAPTRLLCYGGRSRCLAPREAAVLLILIESGSEDVVTRANLLETVWHDQDVSEEVITLTISRLRRHFALLGLAPEIIETVHRAGYRLQFDEDRPPILPTRRRPGEGQRLHSMLAIAMSGCALLIALIALLLHLNS
jgi:DNA-binding winged helix-turn-helix (wHTH) protein